MRYDQALIIEDFKFPPIINEEMSDQNGRFPPASANAHMVPPCSQLLPLTANGSIEEPHYVFPPLGNSVLVEGTREVQAFQ